MLIAGIILIVHGSVAAVAFGFLHYYLPDGLLQLLSIVKVGFQVKFARTEQAVFNMAVGCYPQSVAGVAERVRYRTDKSKSPRGILYLKALGGIVFV